MIFNPEYATRIMPKIREILDGPEPDHLKIERAWRTISYLQGVVLSRQLSNTIGTRVWGGPFKGMQLTEPMLTDLFGPLLLGCYERELHPAFERAIAHPYKNILNIGSNYGYYAVGLAMRMSNATVHAYDIEAEAQRWTMEMAKLNGVESRITIGGEFSGADFAQYADTETLVLMDIEGAEMMLLDPAKYPALTRMDVIVELHDADDPKISRTITERFSASHHIEIVPNKQDLVDLGAVIGASQYFDPYDRLTVAWEKRAGPTPWGIFKKK